MLNLIIWWNFKCQQVTKKKKFSGKLVRLQNRVRSKIKDRESPLFIVETI